MLLDALIETFERLGMSVRFEALSVEDVRGKGGKCRVREREMIIIEKDLSTREKVEVLAAELSRMDCDDIFLPPNVREALEKADEGD